MGNCLIAGADNARLLLPPPDLSTMEIDAGEMNDLLKKATGCDKIILFDSKYNPFSKSQIETFLKLNVNDTYLSERFDCDDFSIVLNARIREWCHNAPGNGAVAFGILTGDLRLKAEDPQRPHAVGFFVDIDKKTWICDGMYNDILEIQPFMTVWNVIV
jgi:hypothetical protein